MAEIPSQAASSTPLRIHAAPKAGAAVICFAGPIEGVLTHWPHAHSVLCAGVDDCPKSLHSGKTIWKGFAAGWVWDRLSRTWFPVAQEITECLEEIMRGRDLVGEVWLLERKGKGRKNDPVMGRFLERRDEPELCTPFNVRLCVERSYHTSRVRWGVANPLPAKTMVDPIAVRGPRAPDDWTPPEEVKKREKPTQPRPNIREALDALNKSNAEKEKEMQTNGQQGH